MTEHLFWCQQKPVINLTGHPVKVTNEREIGGEMKRECSNAIIIIRSTQHRDKSFGDRERTISAFGETNSEECPKNEMLQQIFLLCHIVLNSDIRSLKGFAF